MQSVESMIAVSCFAMQAHSIEGEIVEFGTAAGHTARIIALSSSKQLHLYDSFAGLPDKTPQDGSSDTFKKGMIKVDQDVVLKAFQAFGLPIPHIHPGWFDDLTQADIPDKIAMAVLDGDFYKSILTPLNLIYPRLSPGATVLIHDYLHKDLPGVKQAVDEFFFGKPETVTQVFGSFGQHVFAKVTKV